MLRSRAARFAPATVAAISLTGIHHSESSNKDSKFLPVQCATASLYCPEVPKLQAGVACSQGSHDKELLGSNHWIYHMLCAEDLDAAYQMGRKLGQGNLGTVYLAQDKSMGYFRAVKKIPKGKSDKDLNELMNEMCVLMDLDHPNIIKLVRAHDDGKHFYMISDFCMGPSLSEVLLNGRMSEQEAGIALRQMLRAVFCCHSRYIGHYNINPSNFMFTDVDCKKLKMIDLGTSSAFKLPKHEASKFRGTVPYSAPEVFTNIYGPEADVWSCGLILFAMVTGEPLCPVRVSDDQAAALLQDRRWIKQRLAWASQKITADCSDLLSKMICHDRHLRITAANALRHPFIESTAKHGEYLKRDAKDEEAAIAVIESMTDSFVSFGAQPLLVRAVLLLMVHLRGYTTKETRIHRLAYSKLDYAGSGELSMESIVASMLKCGLEIPPKLEDALKVVDCSQTGYISYSNFLSATLPLSLRCRRDVCQRVFDFLDRNGDGFIDQDDIASTFLSKSKQNDEEYLELCRQAIIDMSGSKSKLRLDFGDLLGIIVGSNSPILGNGFEER